MRYQLRGNRCQGWMQAVALNDDGSEHSASARFTTEGEVRNAIMFHHQNGKWPREVEEQEIEICQACGQPMPSP